MFFRYWLSVGAKPSEPIERLLFRAGFGRQDGASHKSPIAALNGHILNHEQPENADHNKDNGEYNSLKLFVYYFWTSFSYFFYHLF